MRTQKIVLAAILGALAMTCTSSMRAQQVFAQSKGASNYVVYPLILDDKQSLGNTGELRDTYVWNLAFDQGYQAQCAYPKWKISPETYNDLDAYFASYDEATFQAEAVYNVDGSKMKIPIYRGKQANDATYKSSDYEGFFGALRPNDVVDSTQPEINNTGAAYHLLTPSNQCVSKINNLKAIAMLCDTLTEVENCPLDTDVPDAPIKKKLDVLAQFNKYNKMKIDDPLDCEDIASIWNDDFANKGITQAQFAALQTSIQNTTLSFENLYRIGFLVLAPKQDVDEGNGADNFWFLATPSKVNKERHAPIVIAFKIPELATNKSFTIAKETNYKDSSEIVGDVLMSLEENSRRNETELERRTDFLQKISDKRGGGAIINCNGMAACGDGPLLTTLNHALVDIINGSDKKCDSAPVEEVKYTFNSALAQLERDTFFDRYRTVIPKPAASQSFSWELTITDDQRGANSEIEVVSYLVLPLGAELRMVEKSLEGLFDIDSYQAMVAANKLADGTAGVPDYFPLVGDESSLAPSSDEQKFVNNAGTPGCVNVPIVGPVGTGCKQSSIGAKLTESKPATDDLRILGAKLGWLIRKLQENFTQSDDPAHKTAHYCKTIDGLISGNCDQQNRSVKVTGKDIGSCDEIRDTMMPVPALAEFKNRLAAAASAAGISPELLWGVFRTEGTIFLNAMCAGASEVECLINSAGAVGPFQIVTPMCADAGHANATKSSLKNRTGNYCDLETALQTAASEMKVFKSAAGGSEFEAYGWYAYGEAGHCSATAADIKAGKSDFIQGCCRSKPGEQTLAGCAEPMNYCECAQWYGSFFDGYSCG